MPLIAASSPKRFAVGIAALVGIPIFFAVRDKVRLCLAAVVVLITIKIDLYVLGLYAPHSGGAEGLYVKPSDIPLILLYGLWLLDLATHRRDAPRRSFMLLGLFLPFVAAGLVSAVFAANNSWASYEWVRWVRGAALLFYILAKLRTEDVPFLVQITAIAVTAQSVLGLMQTALRRTFGLEKLGLIGEGSESIMAQDFGLSFSMVRAAGTLSHPNLLGAYLDLTLPVFLMLALVDRNRQRRLVWIGALALGAGALICTLSRASWGAFALACLVCAVLLPYMRLINLRRTMTLVFVGASLALIVASPLAPIALRRVTFNFSESLDFRDDMNRLAWRMFEMRPLTGVGLNNFTLTFQEIAPSDAEKMEREWGTVAVVHNLYLLVLSETGALGFAAFLLFWLGFLCHALLGARRLPLWERALVSGTVAGLVATLAGDVLAFALWQDTVNLMAILLVGVSGAILSDQRTTNADQRRCAELGRYEVFGA